MKFGAFTVMLPDLTPEDAAKALAQAGYDGVEWRVTKNDPNRLSEAPSFWGNNLCTLEPTLENAERAKQLADAAGLELPNLGTYLGPDNDVATVEEAMQFAQRAGVPSLRINAAWYRGDYHGAFETSLEFYKRVEPLAKRYKVRALVETHHLLITPSASLAHRFVSHFDPQHVGVIYDPGNMVREGFEAYLMGLQLLGPYLAHVHLKNAAFTRPPEGGVWQGNWAPLEDGVVNFKDVLQSLLKLGYDGWLVMEDFSGLRSSQDTLIHNLNFTKTLLAEVQRDFK
ncbi:MAG: sugar phosphate isomerase/epimerase family protein [Trueperaceae bacterium]